MLSLIAAIILAAGVTVTLHPRFHFGFITELCIAFSALFAGGFVIGQHLIALKYCFLSMLAGAVYYAFKLAYLRKHPTEDHRAPY